MRQYISLKGGEMYCSSCHSLIINPVCSNCLIIQVESWILNKKPSLIPIFRAKIENIALGIKNYDVRCIFCNQNINVSSCVHCLIEDILYLLEDEYPKLAEEFDILFNYR